MDNTELLHGGHPGRILVLEDDLLNALLIEDSLRFAGHRIVGPVGTISQALTLIDNREVDAAVLDFQIHGEISSGVGRRLDDLKIPWAITTAHAPSFVLPQISHVPVLIKPFTVGELLELVRELLGGR
jgi:DNA-binding LytR/AlgR family response regulator